MREILVRCRGAELLPLSALTPLQGDLKALSREDHEKLKASLLENGFLFPFFVWRSEDKNYFIDGTQRDRVLRELMKDADVKVPDLFPVAFIEAKDRNEAARLILLQSSAYGKISHDSLSTYLRENEIDFSSLVSQLDLPDVNLTAFHNEFMTGQLPEGQTDPDDVPAPPAEAVTKPGDLWLLGSHRLLCGDATNATDVQKILGGLTPKMIFTDPPWNVAIGQDSNPRHRQREGLQNDDLGEDFQSFLHGWTAACLPALEGDLYCVMGSREWPAIDSALRNAGMHWSGVIAWVKESFVLGRSNYHHRFEPIWYGWPEKGRSSYDGGRDQDNVWEFPRPKVSEEHPTMKPVDLVSKAVQNSSRPDDLVFDPFLGSGSTLIACQVTGRACAGLEISPTFCDVIVKRWEEFTGQKARREESSALVA